MSIAVRKGRWIQTPEERFWAKVRKTESCWLWASTINSSGYGAFSADSTDVLAHRFAYELLVGPIPAGLVLDHLCRVRHCVNPAHLEPVTVVENLRRGESFSAQNAAKTHCPAGHPYDAGNTIVRRGRRECRACVAARSLRRRRR